jgi:hypothetical protein
MAGSIMPTIERKDPTDRYGVCAMATSIISSRVLMTERRTDHDSADKKGHGAHGTSGFGQEQHVDDADVEPDMTADTESSGTRGDAGWGDQASGGSVIDKRKPDKKKG